MKNKTLVFTHGKYSFSTFIDEEGGLRLFVEDVRTDDYDYPVFYDDASVGYANPLRWPDYIRTDILNWCVAHLTKPNERRKIREANREARQYLSRTELDELLKKEPTDITILMVRIINTLDWMVQTLEYQRTQSGFDSGPSMQMREAKQILVDIHTELKYIRSKNALPAPIFEELMKSEE